MNDLKCTKTFQVMGGEFQFSCFPQNYLSRDEVYALFDRAYAEVKRIEEKYTDFSASYFNRINQSAGLSPVEIDDETFWLIKESIKVSDLSSGIFDISFASVGHLWREYKKEGKVLDAEVIEGLRPYINYQLIELDEERKTIFLPHSQMKIGLGGIGKGYAVDQVYKLFIKEGLYNFYINGSGDIRVHSRVDAPRKWRIGIRNPLSADPSKSVGVIQMDSGAVASSGGYIHNVNGDRFNNHIINPRTGFSAREVIASTVIAEDALKADTTATILMNLSKTEALDYLNKEELSGLIFCKEGKSYLSDRALKNFGMPLQARHV